MSSGKPSLRVVVFGNSGSGKSTFAKALQETHGLAHLDLDTIAWQAGTQPQRRPITESRQQIEHFARAHSNWVIEGCYADLLAIAIRDASELVFLDLPVEACIANARQRPWEPHKYASREAQDANLDMLLDWIAQYTERRDTFSRAAHQALYTAFEGRKTVYRDNAISRRQGE